MSNDNEVIVEPCGWIGCDDPSQDQNSCQKCTAESQKIEIAFDFIENSVKPKPDTGSNPQRDWQHMY